MSTSSSPCEESLAVLVDGARALDLHLTPIMAQRFASYCSVLLKWNQRVNLTAVRSEQGIMRTLFLDSLTLLSAVPRQWTAAPIRLVDVGAGAGVPGIPLKIARERWRLTMIESIGKKAGFLAAAVAQLGLEHTEVLNERAEDAARDPVRRDTSDICTARAVGRISTVLELCSPFVRPGGLVLLPKSGDLTGEIAEARRAADVLHLRARTPIDVPEHLGLGQDRLILVYEKIAASPAHVPRRAGLAKSKPLH